MFAFGDQVHFIREETSTEAVVLYKIRHSYLLWNGKFSLWANAKNLYTSNNGIIPPLQETMIDLFQNAAEKLINDSPVKIDNSDFENISSQLTAAMIRGYLYQSKTVFEQSKIQT